MGDGLDVIEWVSSHRPRIQQDAVVCKACLLIASPARHRCLFEKHPANAALRLRCDLDQHSNLARKPTNTTSADLTGQTKGSGAAPVRASHPVAPPRSPSAAAGSAMVPCCLPASARTTHVEREKKEGCQSERHSTPELPQHKHTVLWIP